jgi:glycosyltransferase involved in cell wall biosynthesis
LLTWRAPLTRANGYAISADAIVRALRKDGVPVTLVDLHDRRAISPCIVTYAPGDRFPRRGIGFTMTEVDGVPADWVRRANAMEEIWTPTDFNRRALLACGVKRPVHVIPLGIDPDQFHPGVARVPNPRGDYVFVSNFEWSERKDPELLLRTFNHTFRCTEPVLLVCKINHSDPGIHVPNAIRALGLDERGGRIYFIYNREIPHHELASLYRSADCFVITSRGEGWGLTPLEAMACGLPAIATDWGGHTAFLDPSDTYPLHVRSLTPAMPSYPYYAGFLWAEPDEEHLSFLLRHVVEHQDEARERGLRASARVRSTFTWRETALRIVARLEFLHADRRRPAG